MITLNLTPLQYDIVKAAVSQYTDGLMKIIEPKTTVTINSPVAPVEAKWGLKKDGTPRARPGRKTARKGRA